MGSAFQNVVDRAEKAAVIRDPKNGALRKLAGQDERTTEYGSASYITKVRSRSAGVTEIVFRANPEQKKLLGGVAAYLEGKELIALDRMMCAKEGYRTRIRFFVTKRYARLAYMWGEMLFEPETPGEPDFAIVDVPEWPARKILVAPEGFVTVILGSDYAGEVKKAGLRMKMYQHKKERGGL
ncbi:MAG: phosphoenolpyruvate carboxykinase (ATP), partial [Candidatus Micrarchaeota archaeon]